MRILALQAFLSYAANTSTGSPAVVGILEERGRSNYLAMVKTLLDVVGIRPNEAVLEVGGGSGVVLREIARRTAGANRIIDVDISPYLLREAEALAKEAGLADQIGFQEEHAEKIPLADSSVDVELSLTVMEEGDADRMLSELVRVTRPGGRIGVIVRSLDMPPRSLSLCVTIAQWVSSGRHSPK